MTTLDIASKANQASTFPALLIAHYANESDPDVSINFKFEEAETLKPGGKAAVEFVSGSGTSRNGSEQAISGLVESYPFLQGKNEKVVRRDEPPRSRAVTECNAGQRMAIQNSIILPDRIQIRGGATA